MHSCGTDSKHLNNPEIVSKMLEAAALPRDTIKSLGDSNGRIPIVFHVLGPGTIQNRASDILLADQIRQINADFAGTNSNINTVPADFVSLKAGDIGLTFYIDRIIRIVSTTTRYVEGNGDPCDEAMKYASLGGSDAIDPEQYLNIWICDYSPNGIPGEDHSGGYAYYPWARSLGGCYETSDGVVIHIGNLLSGLQARTITHEVGHYLNLHHIWNDCAPDATGKYPCCGTLDLPEQQGPNVSANGTLLYPCPSHPRRKGICSDTGDMFMNYMDYTDGRCQSMFSAGQRDEMLWALSTYRPLLARPAGTNPTPTPTRPNVTRTRTPTPTPTTTPLPFSPWKSISCGSRHTIAVREDGTLWGWGQNNQYQAGGGGGSTTSSITKPKRIGSDNDWSDVYAGGSFSLARKNDGTLWSWGANSVGQLGLGYTSVNVSIPTQINNDTWIMVSASDFVSTVLAIRDDNTLWGWGNNTYNQIAYYSKSTLLYAPAQLGTDLWSYINLGSYHAMGIKIDNTKWAWGTDYNCRLGAGLPLNRIYQEPIQLDNNLWTTVSNGSNNGIGIIY